MIELRWLNKVPPHLAAQTANAIPQKTLQYRTGTLFPGNPKRGEFDQGDVIVWSEWQDVPEVAE